MRWLPLFAFGLFVSPAPSAIAIDAPPNFIVQAAPKPLPEVAVANGEGKIGALADFHGKFVLLNIWATWCVPCRKEMPTLDRLQGQLGGPDFEVVALSIDRGGADAVRKFFATVGIHNLAVRFDAAAEAPFKLAAVGLPTTLLIDRQGREMGRLIGPAEWDSAGIVSFLKAAMALRAVEPSLTPKQENHS